MHGPHAHRRPRHLVVLEVTGPTESDDTRGIREINLQLPSLTLSSCPPVTAPSVLHCAHAPRIVHRPRSSYGGPLPLFSLSHSCLTSLFYFCHATTKTLDRSLAHAGQKRGVSGSVPCSAVAVAHQGQGSMCDRRAVSNSRISGCVCVRDVSRTFEQVRVLPCCISAFLHLSLSDACCARVRSCWPLRWRCDGHSTAQESQRGLTQPRVLATAKHRLHG